MITVLMSTRKIKVKERNKLMEEMMTVKMILLKIVAVRMQMKKIKKTKIVEEKVMMEEVVKRRAKIMIKIMMKKILVRKVKEMIKVMESKMESTRKIKIVAKELVKVLVMPVRKEKMVARIIVAV